MRRRATDASFERLQGDSAPLLALASTPLQRFGPVALAPAPVEQGHDGRELRAPPDTSLQAAIGLSKGAALDRIATRFDFALASTRTNMTFAIPGRRQPFAQAKSRELESRATKSARKGVENGGPVVARPLQPPAVSHPHTNGRSRHGPHGAAGRAKGVENGGLRYGAMGARSARRFPHPSQPPHPRPAVPF